MSIRLQKSFNAAFVTANGGFDVFLFNATGSEWASYTSPTAALLTGDYSYGITQTLITATSPYNKVLNQLVIPASGTWYIVFDNRPRGGRTPDVGATVTISWSKFEWVSSSAVQQLPATPLCGSRNVYSGPDQYAYYYFADAQIGQNVYGWFNSSTSGCDAAATRGFIFNSLQLAMFKAGGNYQWSAQCNFGVTCQFTVDMQSFYYFAVSTSRSSGWCARRLARRARAPTHQRNASVSSTIASALPPRLAAARRLHRRPLRKRRRQARRRRQRPLRKRRHQARRRRRRQPVTSPAARRRRCRLVRRPCRRPTPA